MSWRVLTSSHLRRASGSMRGYFMSYKLLLYRDEAYPDSHIADRYPAALKEMLPDVESTPANRGAPEVKKFMLPRNTP